MLRTKLRAFVRGKARREQAPEEPKKTPDPAAFDYDGLRTDPDVIRNHDFMEDPRYLAALQRGLKAHSADFHQYWRLHVALWCASQALARQGDYVECGVWRGFMSSAIMEYLNWNQHNKQFFLFDTFCGIDEGQCTPTERANEARLAHFRKYYVDEYEQVVENFRQFQRVHVIRGSVPASLSTVSISTVTYLSIDMNNVTPEVAAAEYFWDRIVSGGLMLLDDYGFVSYEEQRQGFKQFAKEKNVEILALPTGQGLIMKP